jgi:hypothetical protein
VAAPIAQAASVAAKPASNKASNIAMIKAARAAAATVSKPAIDAASKAAPATEAKVAQAPVAKAEPAPIAKAAAASVAKVAVAPVSKAAAAPASAPVKDVAQHTEEELPLPAAPAMNDEPADDERRRSPRQQLGAKGFVRGEDTTIPGWKVDMVNISMLGIRFRSSRPLEEGERASVKMELGPMRWSSKLRVVHCEAIDRQNYTIGCEFVANELSRPMARAA